MKTISRGFVEIFKKIFRKNQENFKKILIGFQDNFLKISITFQQNVAFKILIRIQFRYRCKLKQKCSYRMNKNRLKNFSIKSVKTKDSFSHYTQNFNANVLLFTDPI